MRESRFAWPAYLVSFGMIAIPLADSVTSLVPLHFQEARWRFGAVGVMSNSLLIPIAGLFLACVAAVLLDHRVFQRVIAIVSGVVAAGLMVALVMFVFDAVQTRADVEPRMLLSFDVASYTAGAKTLLGAITFLAVARASFRRPTAPVATAPMPFLRKTPSRIVATGPVGSGA